MVRAARQGRPPDRLDLLTALGALFGLLAGLKASNVVYALPALAWIARHLARASDDKPLPSWLSKLPLDVIALVAGIVMLVCILGGIGTAGVPAGSLPVVAMILVMVKMPPEGLDCPASRSRKVMGISTMRPPVSSTSLVASSGS